MLAQKRSTWTTINKVHLSHSYHHLVVDFSLSSWRTWYCGFLMREGFALLLGMSLLSLLEDGARVLEYGYCNGCLLH